MKLFVVIAIAALLSSPVWSQTRLTFGPKLGFNLSQHYGTPVPAEDFQVSSGMRPGMMAGAFLDMEILPNFSLGYELLFSQKGSRETITVLRIENEDGEMESLQKPAKMKVKYYLDYLEVPILLKVKVIDKPTYTLSALTGTAMAIKLKGYHRLDGVVYFPDGDGFEEVSITEESKLAEVNMFDYSLVYGGSVALNYRYPIIVEYRFTLGWDYLALPTSRFSEPVELRNQTYSVLIGTKF